MRENERVIGAGTTPRQHRVARRCTEVLVPIGLALLGSLSACFVSSPAGAAGILPGANPLANIAPVSGDFLTSINSARGAEGVGPMAVQESALGNLPIPQQVFTIVNLERVDRGEQPIAYMTAQLNAVAQGGANAGADPGLPTSLSGGALTTYGGAIWAGGLTSVLEADYYWMYTDGWGGSTAATSNVACSPTSPSGCWGHRDIILHQFAACPSGAPTLSMGAAFSQNGYSGGSIAAVLTSTCGAAPSDVTLSWGQVVGNVASSATSVGIATLTNGTGYWEAEANGDVANFGAAQDFGSMAGRTLNSPIVGIAATPDGGGYWLVAADGGIFTFGDAGFHGSAGAIHLVKPIVGMTATPDGGGYWLVASDGGIFSFGDAGFRGSTGNIKLNQPIVGMASDPATGGYWLVASDGGVFSFGAPFFGSTGAIHLNKPIVGMEALANGTGYRFVAADGGIFTFGQAGYDGSLGGQNLGAPVVAMASDAVTGGYWLAGSDGNIYGFGGADFLGRVVA
ncbi:MAG TPA: hypothetical protein VND70_06885 [Acidimicrobiales bacterium]|nr:hypothetical protein [Acidimicrobiales bacterium]